MPASSTTPPPRAASPAPRQVPCPQCRQPALFAPANPYRPFCSARCQGHDFGAWATETYRVEATPPADDAE